VQLENKPVYYTRIIIIKTDQYPRVLA